jgi:hypothetical protein
MVPVPAPVEVPAVVAAPEQPMSAEPRPAGLGGPREDGVAQAGAGKPLTVLAAESAAAGRLDVAIELLDRARQSARCQRDRFIHQLELVELCLSRHESEVARPLVEELVEIQNAKKLEEWEDPGLCARVLIGWIACLKTSGAVADPTQIPDLYRRLCRLDPGRAFGQERPRA